MDILIKLNPQILNLLFREALQDKSKVFWLRDAAYNKQIYVDRTFEDMMKRPNDVLYESADRWADFILPEDLNALEPTLLKRCCKIPEMTANQYYLRLKDDFGNLHYYRDTSFNLYDADGNFIAIAGVGEEMPVTVWDNIQNTKKPLDDTDCLQDEISRILKILDREAKLTAKKKNVDKTHALKEVVESTLFQLLTAREQEVLFVLINGNTGKSLNEITDELYRTSGRKASPDTVRTHLANIRKKCKVTSTAELISKFTRFNNRNSF